jgi:hypothetical protein
VPRDRLSGPRAVDVRAPQDQRLLSDDHLELLRVRLGPEASVRLLELRTYDLHLTATSSARPWAAALENESPSSRRRAMTAVPCNGPLAWRFSGSLDDRKWPIRDHREQPLCGNAPRRWGRKPASPKRTVVIVSDRPGAELHIPSPRRPFKPVPTDWGPINDRAEQQCSG